MVNLSDFYSYRLIGKLTAFLQLQEFSLRKQTPVATSTSVARLSLPSSKAKLANKGGVVRVRLYIIYAHLCNHIPL
jgi:hypothetical protein